MKANQKKDKKGTKKTNESITDKKSKSVSVSNGNAKVKKKSQQLPAKKASENKVKKQSQRINVFQISVQFLKDAKTELKKVKWPTRKELLASTTMVLILSLIIALFLGLIDIGFMHVIKYIVG